MAKAINLFRPRFSFQLDRDGAVLDCHCEAANPRDRLEPPRGKCLRFKFVADCPKRERGFACMTAVNDAAKFLVLTKERVRFINDKGRLKLFDSPEQSGGGGVRRKQTALHKPTDNGQACRFAATVDR